MPAFHFRHDRARRKRFRDDPPLVLVTPPPPATNATASLDAPSRRGNVNYRVNHRCEPMPSTGSHLPNYAARCKMGQNRAYADLIDHLGTLTRNAMRLPLRGTHRFTLYCTPTRLQEATFSLLQGHLGREFPAIPRLDPFAVGWAYLEDQLVRQLRPLASTTAARISSEMSVARVLHQTSHLVRSCLARARRAASVHSRASSRYSSRCWVSSVSSAA
jgi:hypothetical protein